MPLPYAAPGTSSPLQPHACQLPDVNLGHRGWSLCCLCHPGLQSLDYDNSENQLFLEEERRINHMVSLGPEPGHCPGDPSAGLMLLSYLGVAMCALLSPLCPRSLCCGLWFVSPSTWCRKGCCVISQIQQRRLVSDMSATASTMPTTNCGLVGKAQTQTPSPRAPSSLRH